MNPTNATSPDPQNIQNPLNAMREGEVNICEIKRHPIGLAGMYVSFGFLLVVILVVTAIAPSVFTNYNSSEIYQIGAAVFFVALLFASVFMLIGAKVYRGNKWILTSDSLTQVTQSSLFDKQSSQLSLGNLEDVTAQQDGILPHMFNYGLIKVETAGERSKFQMPFCPNPNEFAQKILVAREAFEQGKWYADQRPIHTRGPESSGGGINVNTQ